MCSIELKDIEQLLQPESWGKPTPRLSKCYADQICLQIEGINKDKVLAMTSRLRNLLPEDIPNAYDSLCLLRRSKIEWQFSFLSNEDFKKILDAPTASKTYWIELLTRVYVVILVSCFKTLRWIEALDGNADNYYGFCSTLRGLIESLADTHFTLKKVPITIAHDYTAIREQIAKTSFIITTHHQLEEELLHYIQASKFKKEQLPGKKNIFQAKQITEYIEAIDDKDSNLKELYDFLCGVAHPSYESNHLFFFIHEDETIINNDTLELEKKLIDSLVISYFQTLQTTFRVYYNNILSILLLLNTFDIENIMTHIGSEKRFKEGKVWKDIQDAIADSVERYYKALTTGHYE